ncbi:serine/threonine-protein kinase par-1 isoform X2 [Musca domestica]|uniref:Serine/threonine-protein kinase par-1 isoform X1 n=1 Tax=Musca domestica TaxID=7370 RepID=A0A1I8MUP6_MUSDO|nr:serine/threonine-protein kinase par-1 isoform X2 [Musca domestica]XP_058981762.1 serine/threonine-protein kinase par-1 isoform X2 [Musca domestica]XP_058981763.1 serine/threonine-protein kinase par-1 isoform X2 [Musca domestica]XP_058981764.1 serine/threonine-protein kinase par-1 isoform X2 [Musca domestica]
MSKKPRGSIHKIRQFELEKIHLVDEFDILQIVGEGWFGKILLVEHRASHTEMVLKAVPKPYVSLNDFYREFHYGLHLGIHRNIVTTYDVAFETAGFYVFTQEYAPLGDLTSNVTDTGVGEVYSKRVAKQIGSALDYMHSKDIVHRDVKLDNVLIYRSDFTRVKLCDFGESFQAGTLVERRNEWLPYSPPEVLDIKPEGTYKADPSHDVWQFGIVIFVCLTGCLPWQKAASDDPRYMRYLIWQNSMMLAMRRTPKLFKLLTSRAQRMFKRFLEPRADRRPKTLTDLTKFLDDRWLAKTAEKEMAEYETDELCPSMYSFHSSPDEKNRLLFNLADCGIETNVDRHIKKIRIKEWIESSVITEEDEEELDETNSASSPSSSVSREPVRGHISSLRSSSTEQPKEIKTTLKDANQKHFDPRTGVVQVGPSEMGTAQFNQRQKSDSPSSMASNLSTMMNNDSLAGSLVTLGSRADLISSSLEIYNSTNTDLNRLVDLSQSYDQLSDANENYTTNFAPTPPNKNSIGVGTSKPLGGNKSILQRSKSDSLKSALFASTPALDGGGGGGKQWQPVQPLQPQNNINNKSVTFSGLANSLQTMAPLLMPGMAATSNDQNKQQQQQHQQNSTYPQQQSQQQKNQNNFYDSQVKDSAYGSTEIHDSQWNSSNGKMTPTMNGTRAQNGATYSPHIITINPISTVRTQSAQGQRTYTGAMTTTSMKDTAYDRINPNNFKKRR